MAQLTANQFDGRLREVWDSVPSESARQALAEHLLGGTSADRLASALRDEGYTVGASTIRSWRRNNQEENK